MIPDRYRSPVIFSVNWLICLLLMLSFASLAQELEVSGKVIDAETNLPLPFANIQIENTALGAATNAEGNFKLSFPQRYSNSNLLVSYIGYGLRKIALNSFSRTTIIRLKSENKQLREVVVMPDSSLTVFLRQAYKSIEKNYTQNPYELEGFYRESLKTDKGKYLYFGEAQLIIQGSGYQFENETGNVKVLKSRIHHLTNIDTIKNALYSGGVFIAVADDLIKDKWSVLKPDKKNYHYQLLDVIKNEGKEVWIIGFNKNSGKTSGRLYIEKESKAYIRTEYRWAGNDSSSSFLSGTRVLERSSLRNYKKLGEKWYLQYADVRQTDFNKRIKQKTVIAAEFVTTKTKTDSVSLLPFMQRLSYSEIFSQLKDNYRSDFWDGNTILVQDSSLQSQIVPILSMEKRKELLTDSALNRKGGAVSQPKDLVKYKRLQRIIRIITSIGLSYGLQTLPYSVGDTQLSMVYPVGANNFNTSLESVGFPMLLATEFSFKLNKRWQIFYGTSADLTRRYEFAGRQFGVRYTILLNQRGKPFLLRPSVSYGSHDFGLSFPSFKNDAGISFDNKNVTTNELSFHVGEGVRFLKPSISVEKKIGGRKWLYINAGCYVNLDRENRLYLKDESGFLLFRETRSVPVENSGATVNVNGLTFAQDPKWFTNLYLEAGIRFSY